MLTYNEMLLARQRYNDLKKVGYRAEIEPAAVKIDVLSNAINAVKTALQPNPRKATRRAQNTRAARHTLATE
jgi:hypothetical protein